MKQRAPYVPWFHSDFLGSTLGWSLIEQAVLWKLLCAQWEIGPLPLQAGRLATIVGMPVAEFLDIWRETVRPKFVETEAGYVNERMEVHRENYRAYRQKQSENGRKGGRATWKSKTNVVDFPQEASQ